MTLKIIRPFPESIPGKPISHEGILEYEHAVDFRVPNGTPILAVLEGIVRDTKSDSDIWGLDPEVSKDANYVITNLGRGMGAEYIHFGKDQVVVTKGQRVVPGQVLGFAGYSGFMSEPHVHIGVYNMDSNEFEGRALQFQLTRLKKSHLFSTE